MGPESGGGRDGSPSGCWAFNALRGATFRASGRAKRTSFRAARATLRISHECLTDVRLPFRSAQRTLGARRRYPDDTKLQELSFGIRSVRALAPRSLPGAFPVSSVRRYPDDVPRHHDPARSAGAGPPAGQDGTCGQPGGDRPERVQPPRQAGAYHRLSHRSRQSTASSARTATSGRASSAAMRLAARR